jgi:hypothetical protein
VPFRSWQERHSRLRHSVAFRGVIKSAFLLIFRQIFRTTCRRCRGLHLSPATHARVDLCAFHNSCHSDNAHGPQPCPVKIMASKRSRLMTVAYRTLPSFPPTS